MSAVAVQVCSNFAQDAQGVVFCNSTEWRTAYLLPPDVEPYVEVLMGGFDASAFKLGFASSIGMFVLGIGIGVILAALRKAR
ncbi:hypothetical protein N5C56_24250 [Pseudomonas chengduensis]|nr:hypothetical protein [Pseudomonas chengduensis]MDH1283757.1 hypothetical protein [Pseudomonas chengduensis]